MPRATAARSTAYTYAIRRLQVPAFFDHLGERALEIGKRRVEGRFARVEDQVEVGRPLRAMQAERGAETPLDTVADHGSAEGARHGEAQAHPDSIALARLRKGDEQRTGAAFTVIIDRSEIGGAQNAGRSGKQLPAAGPGVNWRS